MERKRKMANLPNFECKKKILKKSGCKFNPFKNFYSLPTKEFSEFFFLNVFPSPLRLNLEHKILINFFISLKWWHKNPYDQFDFDKLILNKNIGLRH